MTTSVRKSLVCGHRGASAYAPENTLAAFALALKQGADWIEFDVQLSTDNVPIILHDDTLKRTTDRGGTRRPTELTLAELKELDAGSWYGPEYAGEKIPTLDEVLETCGQNLGLNIEIKSRPGFEPDNGIERQVADAVKRFDLYDRAIVSCFDPTRLTALHAYDPKIRIGALYEDATKKYIENFDPFKLPAITGAMALHPKFVLIDAPYMAKAREMGLQVNTWTVNETEDMARMVGLGVDIIITNYPDRLRRVVDGG